VRSVILSLFFGGEADTETKKGSEIWNSIIVFWRGSRNRDRKKEVRSVILSSFLARKRTPKPKKEVRSVILSSFFGVEADTENKKGSEIRNSIIVFGGEPKPKKEARSVILTTSFFGGDMNLKKEVSSVILSLFFGREVTLPWKRKSCMEIYHRIVDFTLLLRTIFKNYEKVLTPSNPLWYRGVREERQRRKWDL